MAAVFGMWATVAIMVVVGVDATAFVVSSSSRSASTNTQLASEYASTRARTQNDYNIDINRELGGPMVSYNGPNTRPVSNIRAPSLGEIWDSTMPVTVQGGSLRTWHFANPVVDAVQVLLKSEGRPIDADVTI